MTVAALGRYMRQSGVPIEQAREVMRAVVRHASNGRIICEMRCCVPEDLLAGFLRHIGDGDEQLHMLTGDIGY